MNKVRGWDWIVNKLYYVYARSGTHTRDNMPYIISAVAGFGA